MSFGGTLQPSVETVSDVDLNYDTANKQKQKANAAPQASSLPTPEQTPEPDVARNRANKTRQQAEKNQQKTNVTQPAPNTATPEPTPEPDVAHNRANKNRQQAEKNQQKTNVTQPAPNTATPEPTSESDKSHSRSDKAQQQTTNSENAASQAPEKTTSESTSEPDSAQREAQQQTADSKGTAHSDQGDVPLAQSKPSFDGSSVPASPNVTESQSEEQQKAHYSANDKEVADRIIKCDPTHCHQILDVPKSCSDEEAAAAYKKLSNLLNPDTNKYPGAQDAFKKLNDAASRLGVPTEEFSSNAYEEELDTDDAEAMDPEENPPPPPDDFSKSIYKQAGPYLGKLMENPDDADAKAALDNLNEQITKNNRDTMYQGHDLDFTIQYSRFIGHFQMAKKYLDTLKEDPQNGEASKKIEEINKILRKLNKRYGYPAEWIIIPPSPKTKTVTWRPGLTRKGEPILAYRTIGGDGHGNPRGYQFVIQTGTKDNPLYDLRSGGEIGRKAADGYRNMGKDKTVRLGEADKKYSRKDEKAFQKILGVASKPIETKTIGTGFQYPVAAVYILCRRTTKDGVKEWRDFVFRQTLRRMLGKTDADEEIKEYYEERKITPPWRVAHTKTRLPKKEKKRQKAAARHTLSSEEASEYEPSESGSSEAEELEDEIVENQELKINELESKLTDLQSGQDKLYKLIEDLLGKQK